MAAVSGGNSVYEVIEDVDTSIRESEKMKPDIDTSKKMESAIVDSESRKKVYINSVGEDDTDGYYSFSQLSMPETGVRVEDIAEYVLNNPDSLVKMKKQFADFPEGLQGDYNTAVTVINRPKNRYKNVYPYDASRIMLSPLKAVTDSDFINASPIHGYSVVNAYIATQGPTMSTLVDFWRMVWEQKCGKIVMLTNLIETKKNKCYKYWPEEDSCCYGDITVTPVHVVTCSEFAIRSFIVKRPSNYGNSTSVERRVEQFHFTAWPDKGVPKYSSSLVHFRQKVISTSVQSNGPIIVHCSAGVGRTGTFIALDWLVDQAKTVDFIDVAGCVATLRRQRMNMVQTEDQYIFLHHTLVEALMLSIAALPSSEFPNAYKDLLGIDTKTQRRKLDIEFEMLKKMSPVLEESDYVSASVIRRGKKKNRISDILPVSQYMPRLPGPGNEFINAVFAPSYKNKNAFIITHHPTADTVDDFWRLVYHYDVGSIVMMESTPENEEQYWPELGDHMTFGEIDVTTTVSDTHGTHGLQDLTVSKGKQTKQVKQFQCLYWPDDQTVPPSSLQMLEHQELVLAWQQNTSNRPIAVHCTDGAERSGLYCVVSAVIERLRLEQDVAIPQMIEQIRSRREQIIPNLDQFKFCHDTVLTYLEEFENYSNFSKV